MGKNQVDHVLDLLHRGRWIVLVTFLVVFSAIAAYTFSMDSVYEANSLVLVSKASTSDVVYYGPGELFGGNGSLANELVILQNSLEIAREVARQLEGMQTVPESGAPITVLQAGEDRTEPLTTEEIARRVQGRMSFGPVREGTGVIRMTASSTVPTEAALLADLYAEEYVELTQRSSSRRVRASREFLEGQVARSLDSLAAADRRIEAFVRREEAVALDQEGTNLVNQISQVEARIAEAKISQQQHQATLHLLEQKLDSAGVYLPLRVASGVEQQLASVQARISALEAERETILIENPQMSADSPQLQEVNRELRELRATAAELSQRLIEEVRAVGGVGLTGSESGGASVAGLEMEAARERIAMQGIEARLEVLNEWLADYEAELDDIPGQQREMAQLQREQSLAEYMYRMLNERLQSVSIAEASEPGYASIIREALVPNNPVRPKTMRNLLAGLFAGLFLGIGLALARDVLDKRIYKPEDLREQGHNVVGVVPNMKAFEEKYQDDVFVEQHGQRFATSLAAVVNPMSPVAEAYRHLRTNIQFSFPDTVVQTVLVTSAGVGEGKTVTAANLAVVMAQAGRRTLLVDTDLRRPRQHKLFGRTREPGLVQRLFSEEAIDAEHVEVESLRTGIDNLYVLPAGQAVPNPAELVGSRSMRELISALRDRFDIVIFDTPPVLAATDAVLLSTQCDATIVVARAGQGKTHEMEHCMKALKDVGATIIGTLLNGFDASMAYGYNYRYYYYSREYGSDYYSNGHSASRKPWAFLRRS